MRRAWLVVLGLAVASCRQVLGLHDLDPDAASGPHDSAHPLDVLVPPTLDAPALDAPPGDAIPLDAIPADWWDPAWRIRVPLTVVNAAASSLAAGYQVDLAADLAGAPCNAGAAFADVRVVYHQQELDRAIDAPAGKAEHVWFQLAAALGAGASASGDYWLYCDNPAAGIPAAGSAQVFDLFQPLSTIDNTFWDKQGSVMTSGSGTTCGNNGPGDCGLTSKSRFPDVDHALDVSVTNSGGSTFWFFGYENDANLGPWIDWETVGASTTLQPTVDTHSAPAQQVTGAEVTIGTASHLFSIEPHAGSATFRFDDEAAGAISYGGGTPDPMLSLLLWDKQSNAAVTYAWIRMRAAVSPAPAVVQGPAQSLP